MAYSVNLKEEMQRRRQLVPMWYTTCGSLGMQFPEFVQYVAWLEETIEKFDE